jgi:hypothetical protein
MEKVLRIAALMLLAAAASTHAAQKKPVDLSVFRGIYHGTVAVTLAGRTYPGTARVVVAAGKKGRSAIMSISGVFRANGKSFPISNRLTFLRSRNFTERSLTNGFAGASLRVTGRYTAHKHKLAFRAPFAANKMSGFAVGTAAVRPGRHGKQVLALVTSIEFDNQPADYVFHFQVSKFIEP